MLGCGGGGVGLRYRLTLATGLVECLCFAGVVFGWASLVFVLKTDGYFTDLCVNLTTGPNSTVETDCSGQDEQFSLVFTVTSFMNNFLTLPNGFIFDRFGTMATRLLGICLYTTGTLMVAFSSSGEHRLYSRTVVIQSEQLLVFVYLINEQRQSIKCISKALFTSADDTKGL
ncbi:equilibrative nucleobase transporter 1-like [Oncorhynchus clarkii lewisi]|uniref:equilibrative nucleobase transporter 1-like n=1 Tax=Oncorhynchus clarkii lewisi TaxID=490388 RepID=UPI0039B92FE3